MFLQLMRFLLKIRENSLKKIKENQKIKWEELRNISFFLQVKVAAKKAADLHTKVQITVVWILEKAQDYAINIIDDIFYTS